jgi:hypothetical protein
MLRIVYTSLALLTVALTPHSSLAAGSSSVEDLTRQLRALGARYQRGDATALGALAAVAATRQQRLAGLIADHPETVLRQALSSVERAALPPAVQPYVEEEQSVDGDLEVIHEDDHAGGRYVYALRASQRLALHFAADPPALRTGDRVRVRGVRVQQALALSSGTTQVTMLEAASSFTSGAQRTLVILVNFQDKPGQTWLTTQQAHDIVFGTGGSVSNFFLENSYQQSWLTGDVYGIYTIAVNSTTCNPDAIATYAKQAAVAHGANLSNYARYLYAFPNTPCNWSGRATVGGYPAEAWINGSFQDGVVAHEEGHNYGLYHSHALDCGTAIIGSSCSSIEYGDTLDTMGSAVPMKHFNAVQKDILGWLDYGTAPPITTVQASGVYTLDPYETTGSNPKALKVKTPAGDWYYVEYRQPLGFDTSAVSGNTNVKNGVVLHLWSKQSLNGVYLLDATSTSSWGDPALGVGSVFADTTAGVSIAPVWVGGTAGVNVTVTGGTACVRNSPTVQVTPAEQVGAAGGTASYTVSVTNNDSGCAASSFSQSATAPSGWAVTFAATALSISPGATASTTMQVKAPAAAPVASYTVSAVSQNASAAGYTDSDNAVYTVISGSGGSFTDSFTRADSSTLGNGWLQVAGTLMVQSGQAANALVRTMHTAVVPALVGAAHTVSASFASGDNNGGPRFGLIVRYKDAQNYYACYRQAGGSSMLRIAKVVNGVETVVKSASIANPAKNTLFRLGCTAQGSALTLSLNGLTKVSVSDSSLAAGSPGMFMGYATTGSVVTTHHADDFSATVQ